MWLGCQSRRFNCLFWRETRQRILGHEISLYPEVVRGREWELTTRPREGSWWLDPKESWWLESREASSRRQLVAGEQRGKEQRQLRLDSREARQHGIGSSDRSQDESDSSSIVEFSLVTDASDSPHMHIVLQYLPLLLVNPKLFVFVRLSFYFFRSLDRILVWWQEMCVAPSNH